MHHHTVRGHDLVGRRGTAGEQVDVFEFRRIVSQQGFYGFCGDLGIGMGYFTVFGKCIIAVGDTIVA